MEQDPTRGQRNENPGELLALGPARRGQIAYECGVLDHHGARTLSVWANVRPPRALPLAYRAIALWGNTAKTR